MKLFGRKKIEKMEADFMYKDHKFFILNPYAADNSPRKLTENRHMSIVQALNVMHLNIERESLNTFIEAAEDANNSGDKQKVAHLLYTLKMRMKLAGFERAYVALGMAASLIDSEVDEDPMITALKWDLVKESKQVEAFFLSAGLKYWKAINPSADLQEIIDYVKDPYVQEVQVIFQDLITKLTSKNAQPS